MSSSWATQTGQVIHTQITQTPDSSGSGSQVEVDRQEIEYTESSDPQETPGEQTTTSSSWDILTDPEYLDTQAKNLENLFKDF